MATEWTVTASCGEPTTQVPAISAAGGPEQNGRVADLAVGSASAWKIALYVGLVGLALVILVLSVQMLRGRGLPAKAMTS